MEAESSASDSSEAMLASTAVATECSSSELEQFEVAVNWSPWSIIFLLFLELWLGSSLESEKIQF